MFVDSSVKCDSLVYIDFDGNFFEILTLAAERPQFYRELAPVQRRDNRHHQIGRCLAAFNLSAQEHHFSQISENYSTLSLIHI